MRTLYRELAEDHLLSTVSYNPFLLQKIRAYLRTYIT